MGLSQTPVIQTFKLGAESFFNLLLLPVPLNSFPCSNRFPSPAAGGSHPRPWTRSTGAEPEQATFCPLTFSGFALDRGDRGAQGTGDSVPVALRAILIPRKVLLMTLRTPGRVSCPTSTPSPVPLSYPLNVAILPR